MKQTRISRGVGVQTEKPSMGGVWIFVEQDNLVRNLAFGFIKLVISGKDYKIFTDSDSRLGQVLQKLSL